MGQNNSQIISEGNQSHQRLGVIKVYEASDMFNQHDNSYRLQLKKSFDSEEKFQKWLSKLRQIDTQAARDVLYLPLSFKYEKTGLCGSSGNLTLTFEYFPYVLKSEIKNRRKMSQYFQESQLWYLLYNLVEAGTIFEKKNIKLGDFHPNNCLLNENGQFKIITSCSLPDEPTNYDKIIDSPTSDAFLAPEQIDTTLLQKGIYPNVDKCKAEVYCIGMTLLEASTLEDCFYTYNRGPYKVNKKRLADLLKIVKEKYKKTFYDVLSNMLQEQTKRRKTSSQIFNELYPYQEAILQLREFNIGGEGQTSVQGKIDQSTNNMQRANSPFGYPQQSNNNFAVNTSAYLNNTAHRAFPVNGSNQTVNYNIPQNQAPTGYGKIVYSNTSIDNGFRK